MLRLKSEVWVKAYIRRCASQGLNAAVVRHGDDDAGAIYIKINRLDGTCHLFGPAAAGLEETDRARLFSPCVKVEGVAEEECDSFIQREMRIDSDIWVIEVEDRQGRHLLDDELVIAALR